VLSDQKSLLALIWALHIYFKQDRQINRNSRLGNTLYILRKN